MTAAAIPFSWFQIDIAASLRSSGVRSGAVLLPCSIMACCAAEFATRRPSWGVHNHQTTAKKTVHEVENIWSAKNK